ncbi:MAG: two-component regulator propeller domain-containing protein, partial [Ferruginibacter sp.]
MVKHLLFILFYALYSLPAHPQSFSSKLYTTADGLSDNYIFSVYQDSYGYIWVGTANGLNRYDGKRFITFGLKNGLPSTAVDKIFEDSHHRLWIGTRRGISEFKSDTCYNYPTSDSLLIGFVSSFLEISPGKIWAATNRGVYELNNKVWVKKELYPGFKDQHVSQIVNTSHGMYINYNGNRLVRKVNDNYEELYNKNLKKIYFNGVYQRNDTVYLSTYSGLFRLDGNKFVSHFEDTLKRKF